MSFASAFKELSIGTNLVKNTALSKKIWTKMCVFKIVNFVTFDIPSHKRWFDNSPSQSLNMFFFEKSRTLENSVFSFSKIIEKFEKVLDF